VRGEHARDDPVDVEEAAILVPLRHRHDGHRRVGRPRDWRKARAGRSYWRSMEREQPKGWKYLKQTALTKMLHLFIKQPHNYIGHLLRNCCTHRVNAHH
jgi:hypothetical protein